MNAITSWVAKPFDADGSALNWALFLLLLILIAGFWQFVLFEVQKEI